MCNKDGKEGGCGNGGCGGAGGGYHHRGGRIVKKLLMIAGVVYLALLARNAAKQHDYIGRPESQRDIIVIAGEGKVTAIPDIATVSVGVQTEKKSVKEAQDENSRKMNAIIDKMKSLKIAKEDIKTTNYSIYPQYDYTNGRSVLRGYQVNQSVDVKIRNLDLISQVLSGAGELGANTVGGVNFTIDEPEGLRQEARLKALEAAKTKATALAEAAGVRLGKVVGFSESVGGYSPPIMYAKEMAFGLGGDSAASPSIESGSQDVVVNVSVTYEILP